MRLCSIDGCERKYFGGGFCEMHYSRMRHGITDMRPEKLPRNPWNWDKRPRKGKCSIEECGKPHYANGLCHNHYERNRRNGTPEYIGRIKPCIVEGCTRMGRLKSGMCDFHQFRLENNIPFDLPGRSNKGERNVNWKGGVAQYPNHSELKRIRKQRLEEENYTCQICKSEAHQTHHLDSTKSNHDPQNLLVVCRKCHMGIFHNHNNKSKYSKQYGMTLSEIEQALHISRQKLMSLHKAGELHIYLDHNNQATQQESLNLS